jgi:hypothetical protein
MARESVAEGERLGVDAAEIARVGPEKGEALVACNETDSLQSRRLVTTILEVHQPGREWGSELAERRADAGGVRCVAGILKRPSGKRPTSLRIRPTSADGRNSKRTASAWHTARRPAVAISGGCLPFRRPRPARRRTCRPSGLIAENVLERASRVLLAQEKLDRFRVALFDRRVGGHARERNAVRNASLVSLSAVAPAASKDDQPGHSTRPLSTGHPRATRSERRDGRKGDGRAVPLRRALAVRAPRRNLIRNATNARRSGGCNGSATSGCHRSVRWLSLRRRWPSCGTVVEQSALRHLSESFAVQGEPAARLAASAAADSSLWRLFPGEGSVSPPYFDAKPVPAQG